MADYTSGPWHYATTGPGLLGVFCGDGRFARPADLIAGVAASDNHEANARLIAAAPDLLAMLEATVPMIESYIKVSERLSDGRPRIVDNVVRTKYLSVLIDNAIAKARGE